MKRFIVVALACAALIACGKSLSGTYVARAGSGLGSGIVMQKMTFVSSDTVELTMLEQTFRTSYKIDGGSLVIDLRGQQQVFKIGSDGCLDGGGLLGTLCKA